MQIRYKKNLKTVISHFIFLIGMVVFVSLAYIYFYFKFGYNDGYPLLIGGLFFLFFYLIPALFLHIEYSVLDRKTVITYYTDKKLYFYDNSKIKFEFSKDNISKITLYKDKIGWYSTSSFFYIKLELQNHPDNYIITSYIIEKMLVDKEIEKRAIKKNRLIPSPFLEKLLYN